MTSINPSTGAGKTKLDLAVYVPDFNRFIDPFAHPVISRYLRDVHDWHGFIKFLGLPILKDMGRDVGLSVLYVEPRFSVRPVAPEELNNDKTPPTVSLGSAIEESQCLIVLGNPGSGKSTLVNWLCETFSQPEPNPITGRLGQLIPIPLILRDLKLPASLDWDALIGAFLDRPIAARFERNRDLLESVFANGQALFLFDGLDEISQSSTRALLRDVIMEGLHRYPNCKCICTSRTVGYEEYAIDPFRGDRQDEIVATPMRGALWDHALTRIYVSPFDDGQIAQFATKWFRRYSANPFDADTGARDFVHAIHENPATHALARIPNLLTMMALIFRVRSHLPYGRALLYDKISEAYLESIDTYRRIPSTIPMSRADKERWLGEIAFEMQLRRQKFAENQPGDEGQREILISEDELLTHLTEFLKRHSGRDENSLHVEARAFLETIAKRSGLLLPRGERLYGFMHLTFQEYYAALRIRRVIKSPKWMQNSEQSDIPLSTLERFVESPIWRESVIFLFERLAEDEGWCEWLANKLFHNVLQISIPELKGDAEERTMARTVSLLATISLDPHTGLELDFRKALWDVCWKWVFVPASGRLYSEVADDVTQALFADGPLLESVMSVGATTAQQVKPWMLPARKFRNFQNVLPFLQIPSIVGLLAPTGMTDTDMMVLAENKKLTFLVIEGENLSNFQVFHQLNGLSSLRIFSVKSDDFSWLSELTKLEHLTLFACGLKNLDVLNGLSYLTELVIKYCNAITSIAPLINLKSLVFVDFSDCEGITDFSPLADLPKLRRLRLSSCEPNLDLTPFAGKQIEVALPDGKIWYPELEPVPKQHRPNRNSKKTKKKT